MSYLELLLLGVVQGIAEFLPISSDGHLALAAFLFDIEGASLTTNVMLHAGTLLATALILRAPLSQAIGSGFAALRTPRLWIESSGGRDAAYVVLVSVPTALIGLGLRDTVEDLTRSPFWVGIGFLMTAAFLASTFFHKGGEREHLAPSTAILLGLAQGLAVLPGISRSGSTIAVLLFLGLERKRAFELSMLMSVPAVFGAILLELPHLLEVPGAILPAVLGAVVAFATGAVALVSLRNIVRSGKFAWFAFWVFPVGLATLALSRTWPS